MNASVGLSLVPQRTELTEHLVYARLAARMKDEGNRRVLEEIAADELRHHDFWRKLSGVEVRPRRLLAALYVLLARLLGLTFAVKLMELGERRAVQIYGALDHVEGVRAIAEDEERHERALLAMLHEERLEYAGSIVLGLNDALVELTGALAGLTLALRNPRVVAMVGLVTGLAASLSMAASGYLALRADEGRGGTRSPLKAAAYTGVAYVVTVLLLIVPFLVLSNIFLALATTLILAVLVVAAFTFYISVAKSQPFWPRFAEMAAISVTVAAFSFLIGWLLRQLFGIEA